MATNSTHLLIERHNSAQLGRRAVEREWIETCEAIKTAIRAGDASKLRALQKRKSELPAELTEASANETGARREWLQEVINVQFPPQLSEAEAEIATAKSAYQKRKSEVEGELAQMLTKIDAAEKRLVALQSELRTCIDLSARGERGYERALQELSETA